MAPFVKEQNFNLLLSRRSVKEDHQEDHLKWKGFPLVKRKPTKSEKTNCFEPRLRVGNILLTRHHPKNKVTPLLAAPWIPCISFYAFSSVCEPLQNFVGFLILAHVKILCIFQFFYLILWNVHCVFEFHVPKPQRQAVFFGVVFSIFCTTCLTRQESYLQQLSNSS